MGRNRSLEARSDMRSETIVCANRWMSESLSDFCEARRFKQRWNSGSCGSKPSNESSVLSKDALYADHESHEKDLGSQMRWRKSERSSPKPEPISNKYCEPKSF